MYSLIIPFWFWGNRGDQERNIDLLINFTLSVVVQLNLINTIYYYKHTLTIK